MKLYTFEGGKIGEFIGEISRGVAPDTVIETPGQPGRASAVFSKRGNFRLTGQNVREFTGRDCVGFRFKRRVYFVSI